MLSRLFALLGVLPACGSGTVVRPLAIGTAYDAVGVVRVLPDGIVAASQRGFYILYDGLSVSNGQVAGTVSRKGTDAPPAQIRGTFESSTGQLTFDPFSASITSTAPESIEQLGGRADDLLPKDGIADEIAGFIRTRKGTALALGSYLGTQRQDPRPAAPADDKIAVMISGPGTVRAVGQAGATRGSAGVEIFRYQIAAKDPTPTLGQADADGGFSISLAGDDTDLFILRARVAGIASDGRLLQARR